MRAVGGGVERGVVHSLRPGRGVWLFGMDDLARDGTRRPIDLDQSKSLEFAAAAAKSFGVADDRFVEFSTDRAKEDAKKK